MGIHVQRPNVALLTQTLEYIRAHPDELVQHTWRCNTGCCFAGHAAILSGARWQDPKRLSSVITTPNGSEEWVSSYAKRVLGLNRTEADWLFDANNTLGDLVRKVAALAAGQPTAVLADGP